MTQSFLVRDQNDSVVGTSESGVYPAGSSEGYTNTKVYNETYIPAVRSLRYPMKDEGDHFIRFFINLNEESKLIKRNIVSTTGYVDNRDQNRANTNTTDINAIETAGAVAGGAVGANIAAGTTAVGAAFLKNLFKSKKAKAAAGVTATGVVAAGAAGGYAAGEQIASVLSETFRLQNRLKKLAANITIYTPAEVRSNYSFQYETPDDLLVTLAQSQNYEALKASLNQITSPMMTDDSLDNIVQRLGESGSEAGQTLGKFGRILASANQTVSLLSRTAINTRRDVLFRYVGNRSFQFNFVFAPRNKEEANEVSEIIKMFKYFAHPEMLPGYGNFLYLYPAEFDIEYGLRTPSQGAGPEEYNNQFLNKISSCVVENMTVDYAPGGSFQSLERGEPIITTLSLSFKEIETLHRDRIAEGY
jgi:hypothetical protein